MLPIKKRYNPLTMVYEDVEEYSFLPSTTFPSYLPQTNEFDVSIAEIKANVAIKSLDYNFEIAKLNANTTVPGGSKDQRKRFTK